MPLTATKSFTARISGRDIRRNKGETFDEKDSASQRLKRMGLLVEAPAKEKPKKKGDAE